MYESVAVLICLYEGDRQGWFETAVSSVLEQDYQGDVHIYLGIDGPLPDQLESWLKQHDASFYEVLRNTQNIGLSKMLNRLIDALGDETYVFRLDADDICLPQRFSRQIKFLQDYPEVDMVGGSIWEMDETALCAWKKSYPERHEEICRYLTRANPFAHSTVCFRRGFFDKVPSYPDHYRYNQDLALWVESLKRDVKMANLSVPVVCLRISEHFYARRGVSRAISELMHYLAANRHFYGWNWRMFIPFLRFVSRLLPTSLVQVLYRSKIRRWVCKQDATTR